MPAQLDRTAPLAPSRWGRVRGSRRSTLWIAVPAAIVLAALVGVAVAVTGVAGPEPLVGALAFAFAAVWPCFGLVWVLVVDRTTLRGAVDRPEESVESRWYDAAAGSAFTDVVLVVGIAATVLAVTGLEPPVVLVLPAVIVVAAVAFCIRYLLLRARG